MASYAATWESVQVASDGTKRILDNAIRLHIVPALGAYPIASVRPTMIQGFVKKLEAKNLAAGTVRNIYEVLAQVLAAAVDDRVIAVSPCRKITLPKDDKGEVEITPVEDVVTFADSIGDRWRALVVLLAGSGLRIGEARGLEVGHINFLKREIRVVQQRNQAEQVAPLKSASSRRTVPVGQVVIDELAAHLAAYPTTGPLFTDELGRPLPMWRLKKIWAAGMKAANAKVTEENIEHAKKGESLRTEISFTP